MGRAASCGSGREPEGNGDGFGEPLALLELKPSELRGKQEAGAEARDSGTLSEHRRNVLEPGPRGPEGSQLVPRPRAQYLRSVSLGEVQRAEGPPVFWFLVAHGCQARPSSSGWQGRAMRASVAVAGPCSPRCALLWGTDGFRGSPSPSPPGPSAPGPPAGLMWPSLNTDPRLLLASRALQATLLTT